MAILYSWSVKQEAHCQRPQQMGLLTMPIRFLVAAKQLQADAVLFTMAMEHR